jgi:hypothetical protein
VTGPMLDSLPFGRLLARLLWLALAADTREAFVGDLVEEALLRRRFCTREQVGRWVWGQTLRSLPALLRLRLHGLAAALVARLGGRPARPLGLVAGPRGGHRGWPVSLAVSLSAHGVVVAAAVALVLSRVEEVQPPAVADIEALVQAELEAADPMHDAPAPPPPPAAEARPAPVRGGDEATAPRRDRPTRKPLLTGIAPLPLAGPQPGDQLPGAPPPSPPSALLAVAREAPPPPAGPPPAAGPGIWLPPRVAEKRCVSCPQPQLPPHYARLARGQAMMVRACVSAQGEVQSATVVHGLDSVIDREVTEAVRGWRLMPYFLNGHPVPFCYATRFLFVER